MSGGGARRAGRPFGRRREWPEARDVEDMLAERGIDVWRRRTSIVADGVGGSHTQGKQVAETVLRG
jgi:hypothetical protein